MCNVIDVILGALKINCEGAHQPKFPTPRPRLAAPPDNMGGRPSSEEKETAPGELPVRGERAWIKTTRDSNRTLVKVVPGPRFGPLP